MVAETTRKLAAVVFTDIVGFTKLSGQDEKTALELLDNQRDLLKPIVDEYNGDWLKEMGDGLLLTFPTVSAAVECSIKIQKAVKNIENLNLRIGIHEGEITEKGGDVFGDDVNVASRIEPFSAPGGIAISGKVQQNISSLPEFKTEFLGQPNFKGVAQKVEVYCITSHSLPRPNLDKIKAKLEPKKNKSLFKRVIFPITGFVFTLIGGAVWFILPLLSFSSANETENYEKRIAVLYFENRGKSEDLYFADGLTEEIISRLSRVTSLSVVSRFDIAEFKGKNINIKNITERTQADFVLSGNVLRINDKIKITAELMDVSKRNVPWSDTFEKNVTDIFSVQDEVALNIVNNLDIKISSSDRESVIMDPSSNAGVYDRLTKAKAQAYNLRTSDGGIDNMIATLNEIVAEDTTYADALSTRGFYLFLKFWYQGYWMKSDSDTGKNILNNCLLDLETSLKHDPNNRMGLAFLPVAHLVSLWTLPSATSKIFTARKALVEVNEFREKYPDDFMSNFVKGIYHRLKARMAAISSDSDYELAVKYLSLSIEQTRNAIKNNISDPMIKNIYEEGLNNLAYFQQTYSDYSSSIRYYGELEKINLKDKQYERLSRAYLSHAMVLQLIGNYESSIDYAFKYEKLHNQIKTPRMLLLSKMLIASNYIQMGEAKVGVDILNEVKDDYKSVTKTGLDIGSSYHYLLALAHAGLDQNNKTIAHLESFNTLFNNIVEEKSDNEFHHWVVTGKRMAGKSLLALTHARLDNKIESLDIIRSIETEIKTQPRLFYESSVEILYNIGMAYSALGESDRSRAYIKRAATEMNRIADMLADEDRTLFLNNIVIHKKIQSVVS
ncbi:MAG: adenylate/guanylate cyclase domain-containing protein [Candidatus Marinimicrobia bacterium]|nr:adenylate/guanylate cyclase domain-containing protein [Candidatus Neomarinimicrobiota bacterium]